MTPTFSLTFTIFLNKLTFCHLIRVNEHFFSSRNCCIKIQNKVFLYLSSILKEYPEQCQTSKMELYKNTSKF